MEHGMDNDWRFVKEGFSNPEEMRELVWKRTMLSCMLQGCNKKQYFKVQLHIQ
jgi:hypothetical protein